MCNNPTTLSWNGISLIALALASLLCVARPTIAQAQNHTGLLHQRPAATAAEKSLVAETENDSPENIYKVFNEFCKTHFGAEADPLIYQKLGKDLTLLPNGAWKHISENSASLAWETNLPAVSYVEYGETEKYGKKTDPTDRAYFLHVHLIKDLPLGKTFHYRLVAVDERGNRITSPDQTFTTAPVPGAVHIPGTLQGPPYKLENENTTYILTKDLTVPSGAIITMRDGITIDLNGHTITYAQGADSPKEAAGIIARGSHDKSKLPYMATDLKIVNGFIVQGTSPTVEANTDSLAYNALSLPGQNIELAGLHIVYHASQSWGVQLTHSKGNIHIHHNVFKDMGAKIANRHGTAVRTVGFRFVKESPNSFVINHNLIQRTRQNGFSHAHQMFNNEVYVDSWSTNSFALQPESVPGIDAGEHHHNRVFATGFNPYGFGWAHENLKIHDNLIYMFGLDTSSRWQERWGDINMLSAIRVTNYGKGGQVRNNLQYWDNLVIMRGRDNAELRGVEFFSDETIKDLVFRNNIVITETLDNKTPRVACIDAQGHYSKANTLPVIYRDNLLISNACIVRFGDSYGKGNNHQFYNNRFVKFGDNPDFHTFVFGGAYYNNDHLFIDNAFEDGTRYDDVYWSQTSSRSYYSVGWTLTINTAPNAAVSITDSADKQVYSGQADAKGQANVALLQCTIHPTEWSPTAPPETMTEVVEKSQHKVDSHTPHTVTVTINGKSVTKTVSMDKQQTIDIKE